MMEEQEQEHDLTIDLDYIHEIARRGVRRAAVFLGITANATAIRPPISHVLDETMRINFLPDKVTEAQQQHFLDEFGRWVVSSVLRDLVDNYSVFLAESYKAALHIMAEDPSELARIARRTKQFEKENVPRQLEILCGLLATDNAFADMFSTLRNARNCLSHRLGVVGPTDVNTEDGHLAIRWPRLETFVREADGRETSLTREILEERRMFQQGTLCMRYLNTERLFPVGQPIRLSRRELSEVCLAVHLAGEDVARNSLALARRSGSTIVPGD